MSWRAAIPFSAGVLGCAGAGALAGSAVAALIGALGFVAGALVAISSRREPPAAASAPTPPERPVVEHAPPPEPTPAPPVGEPTLEQDEARRLRAELAGYPVFARLLANQARGLSHLTEETAQSIMTRLATVDAKITALLDFIRQAGSNAQTSSVIAQVEARADATRELLSRFSALQRSDAQAGHAHRSKLIADTQRVLDVLEGVGDIARHTTMLSFNVSIEAARAGDAGKGFAVIATEIRKLASQAQQLSTEVKAQFEALMHTVAVDLQQRAAQREHEEGQAVANLKGSLDELAGDVRTIVSHQSDILQKVEAESEAVAQPIMDIMGSLQFQDVVRQQLEQLEQMSAMVDDHILSLGASLPEDAAEPAESVLLTKLDEYSESFRMRSQRDDLRTARGGAAQAEAALRIEMF